MKKTLIAISVLILSACGGGGGGGSSFPSASLNSSSSSSASSLVSSSSSTSTAQSSSRSSSSSSSDTTQIESIKFNIASAAAAFLKNGGTFSLRGDDKVGNNWALVYDVQSTPNATSPSIGYIYTKGDSKQTIKKTLERNGMQISVETQTRYFRSSPFAYSYFNFGGGYTYFNSSADLPLTAKHGDGENFSLGKVFSTSFMGDVTISWLFSVESKTVGKLCFNSSAEVLSTLAVLNETSECLVINPSGAVSGVIIKKNIQNYGIIEFK